jgi:hypothetical protein
MQLGMGKDINLHEEMRMNNGSAETSKIHIGEPFRNNTHLRPPTSSSTLPTGRLPPADASFETESNASSAAPGLLSELASNKFKTNDQQPPVNFAVSSNPANLYIRIDERKWSSTFLKVYRHMRLMEKTKYLEPHFSIYVTPIAKYVSTKFKLGGGSIVSSSYNSQPSSSQISGLMGGPNNRESMNGAIWKK